MKIEANTGRHRAVSRKTIERALHRSSDAVVLHLRYAGSDVGAGQGRSQQTDEHESPPEI